MRPCVILSQSQLAALLFFATSLLRLFEFDHPSNSSIGGRCGRAGGGTGSAAGVLRGATGDGNEGAAGDEADEIAAGEGTGHDRAFRRADRHIFKSPILRRRACVSRQNVYMGRLPGTGLGKPGSVFSAGNGPGFPELSLWETVHRLFG